MMLANLDYQIIEGHMEETALFALPATNTALISVEENTVRRLTQLTPGSSCIEFAVPGSGKYLDLSKTSLYLQLWIKRQDGGSLATSENVTLVNNPVGSLFSQVDVNMGGTPVNKIPSPLYAYKAYF